MNLSHGRYVLEASEFAQIKRQSHRMNALKLELCEARGSEQVIERRISSQKVRKKRKTNFGASVKFQKAAFLTII